MLVTIVEIKILDVSLTQTPYPFPYVLESCYTRYVHIYVVRYTYKYVYIYILMSRSGVSSMSDTNDEVGFVSAKAETTSLLRSIWCQGDVTRQMRTHVGRKFNNAAIDLSLWSFFLALFYV